MLRSFALGLLSLVLTAPAFAAVLETRIFDVETGEERAMVLAENDGRVLWIANSEGSMIRAFQAAVKSGRVLKVSFDGESGVVKSASTLARKVVEDERTGHAKFEVDEYRPTLFNSPQQAQSYFNTMDGQTKDDSQCYNRAHGWAYDLWNQYRINSLKVFIFFTRRYIREFNYKWWFHVSPMVLVGSGGYNTEFVMDRSFTKGPTDVQSWTNVFMKNRAYCPTVNYYSQYRNNQEAQYCYLMKSIMYYSTPRDLEYLETRGRYEDNWDMNELRVGRKQAFINWQRYNP